MPFLTDRIQQHALEHPHRSALECGDTTITYQQLHHHIQMVSERLQNGYSNAEDRIAIVCNKTIESVILLFACWATHRCTVLVNPTLRDEQIAHIVSDSGARMLLIDSARLQSFESVLLHSASLRQVIVTHCLQPPTVKHANTLELISWNQFLDQQVVTTSVRPEHSEQTLACLIYTSGSTGLPKGVMVSHQNLYLGAESVCQFLNSHHDDRILAMLPLSFDYGLNQLTHGFYAGATVVLYDYLLPGDILRTLIKKSITGLAGLPTLWHAITAIEPKNERFESLRYITNSGGKLTTTLLHQLQNLFPHTQIYSMYGTTEAFRSTYLSPNELNQRPDSIGKAVPHAELHVLDQHFNVCKPGEIGEFVHAGPLVTMGYWNKDSSVTDHTFETLPDHLNSNYPGARIFHTGDLGYIDEAGFFYFSGRKDEMIKTSGYRVSPTEIEAIALHVTGVIQAVAFGEAHEQLGQSIVLVITSNRKQKQLTHDIETWFRAHTPQYMRPRKIFITDNIPLSPNGKPDRFQLRQQYCNE